MRSAPPGRQDGSPDPSTIREMARLIAERAGTATVYEDLEVICRLLRQKFLWSEESLARLRRAVASVLDAPSR